MGVCMADTKTVLRVLKVLKKNGCTVTFKRAQGTATAIDEGVNVYMAIHKGDGSWIVRTNESNNIKWGGTY